MILDVARLYRNEEANMRTHVLKGCKKQTLTHRGSGAVENIAMVSNPDIYTENYL